MQPPSSFTAPIRSVDSVEHFTATTDVLICGYGGAGAAAALEAARHQRDRKKCGHPAQNSQEAP